jgi:ParB family chromosome partitioning protein
VGAEALDGRRRLAGAYFIDIGRVHPDPSQPRRQLDTQAQLELTQSVKQFGIMQPITVRYIDAQKTYQIISGERRYQAALRAKLTEIPCWVQSPREEEILVRQIVENWQRSDLSPFELADALASIRDAHGYSQIELAKITGKPKSEISRLLALLDMSPEAQKAARTQGQIGKRQLYAIARADPTTQVELVREVHEHRLTAAETEKLASRTLSSDRGARKRGAPTSYRRFVTSAATVALTFRKRHVEQADVLRALDEVRKQISIANRPGN